MSQPVAFVTHPAHTRFMKKPVQSSHNRLVNIGPSAQAQICPAHISDAMRKNRFSARWFVFGRLAQALRTD
jgi:hypothetical protein